MLHKINKNNQKYHKTMGRYIVRGVRQKCLRQVRKSELSLPLNSISSNFCFSTLYINQSLDPTTSFLTKLHHINKY